MTRSGPCSWFVRCGGVAALGALAAAAACSSSAGPDGTGTVAGHPNINSIAPLAPFASTAPQTLQFSGENFDSGLSVLGSGPDGNFSIAGGDIANFTDSSFAVSLVLDIGTYQFTVRNSDGTQSVPFPILVQDPNDLTGPQITAVSPATPSHGAAPQQLFVTGAGFDPGQTVTLTDPLGAITILSGPQLLDVTSGSFDITVTLPKSGVYSLQVTSSSDAFSNTFNFKTS